jgi:hypothetical protein
MAKVTIDGNERVLQPFRAAKALEAAALISEIVEHGGEIFAAMDTYAAEHAQRNTLRISRAAAFFRDPERAAAVPDDAWQGSGNVLEVPGPRPAFEEQLLAVFPQIFRAARDQVLKLLALVLVDEADLERADTEGGVEGIDALLKQRGRQLLYEAQMEELLPLGRVAWAVCQEQLRADPTALALLEGLKARWSRSQPTAPASAPASSPGSPRRSGGRAKKSSSASRGVSSAR